jgi:hypothetical protein
MVKEVHDTRIAIAMIPAREASSLSLFPGLAELLESSSQVFQAFYREHVKLFQNIAMGRQRAAADEQ